MPDWVASGCCQTRAGTRLGARGPAQVWGIGVPASRYDTRLWMGASSIPTQIMDGVLDRGGVPCRVPMISNYSTGWHETFTSHQGEILHSLIFYLFDNPLQEPSNLRNHPSHLNEFQNHFVQNILWKSSLDSKYIMSH